MIRLFWLLQHESLGNDYHQIFRGFFNESLFERYSIWHLHRNYTADPGQMLGRFYAFELIAGIQRYANRKTPELSMQKEEFFWVSLVGVK